MSVLGNIVDMEIESFAVECSKNSMTDLLNMVKLLEIIYWDLNQIRKEYIKRGIMESLDGVYGEMLKVEDKILMIKDVVRLRNRGLLKGGKN